MGGGAPIVVQSMTNTDTADVGQTVAQVEALARAGSELVRITVDREEAAAAVPAEMLANTNLVGPVGHVKERLAAYAEAGVTHLSVNPVGKDPVKTIEQLRELIS